jgi:hypothetical protein
MSNTALIGKYYVKVWGRNQYGPQTPLSFDVKVDIGCIVSTLSPDPSDMSDPVLRYTKDYYYKVGDPMLQIPFKKFLYDIDCGLPFMYSF